MQNETFNGIDVREHGLLTDLFSTIRSMDLGGKNIIQTLDGQFIEYILMDEDYFVNNWLAQFAIGRTGKHNYFDQTGWNKLTDGYTKGVIVINEEKLPVLIIRKFIDMNLDTNQASLLEHYTRRASDAANIPNKSEVDKVLSGLADIVTNVTEITNPDYDTLTAMVPYEYYLSKGINPIVMKQVIWIRDNYTYEGLPLTAESPVLKEIEGALLKNANGDPISQAEIDLVIKVTNGDFEFNGIPNKVETQNSSPAPQKDFDPLSD